MQSSPTELSNKFTVQESSSEPLNTDTQHGLQQDPIPKDSVSVQLQGQLASASVSSTSAAPAADGFATHATDASSGAEESGLSTPVTPSSRYGARVYDYESALTPISRRSSDGPVFEIIPSTGVTAGKSPIADLPNGESIRKDSSFWSLIQDQSFLLMRFRTYRRTISTPLPSYRVASI